MSSNKNGLLSNADVESKFILVLYQLRSSSVFPWQNFYKERMLNLVEYLLWKTQMLRSFMSLHSRWQAMCLDITWKFLKLVKLIRPRAVFIFWFQIMLIDSHIIFHWHKYWSTVQKLWKRWKTWFKENRHSLSQGLLLSMILNFQLD